MLKNEYSFKGLYSAIYFEFDLFGFFQMFWGVVVMIVW